MGVLVLYLFFCQVSVQTVSISLLIYAPFFAMFLLFDFYSCNCLVMLDYALGPKLSLPACYPFQAVNSNSLAPNLQGVWRDISLRYIFYSPM